MDPVLLFEDDSVRSLDPVALGRPACDILCGGTTLAAALRAAGAEVQAVVRPHLQAAWQAVRAAAHATGNPGGDADKTACGLVALNARLAPSAAAVELWRWLAALPRGVVVRGQGCTLAARVPGETLAAATGAGKPCPAPSAGPMATGGSSGKLGAWLDALALPTAEARIEEGANTAIIEPATLGAPASNAPLHVPLLNYAHDIVRHHPPLLQEYLAARIARGDLAERADGLFAAPTAELGPHLVADTRQGPIVIEEGARIGPFCYLRGPVLVGAGAKVIEHAALKDGACLGHTTKVGGEVECSIIEPYSNKQHFGFLGHSYLGRWVNLGAGTTNSDLKNTYGTVAVRQGGQRIDTGMQFLGCIVGDYAKTAIHTSLFTGKRIGFGSMLYGTVTCDVPSFVNYALSLGQVTEVAADVVVRMQARMFARRGLEQRPCDAQLIREVFALTADERDYPSGPPAF